MWDVEVTLHLPRLFLFHSPMLVWKLTLEAEYLLLGKRYPSELRANGDDGLRREKVTLAPFCKSFGPVTNNCREGLCRCSVSGWLCLVNIC